MYIKYIIVYIYTLFLDNIYILMYTLSLVLINSLHGFGKCVQYSSQCRRIAVYG
jgi:hypothetical protein